MQPDLHLNPKSGPYLTPRYPELGTAPIPTEPYRSEAYLERERDRIFRKVWLNVGRVELIPGAGDYFVRDILNASVLVVRQEDGSIRAFHNACAHRSTRVVIDQAGKAASGFTCMFHAWRYDVAGRLAYVTDEHMFFNLDRAANGLTPVACDIWNGWIHINLDPDPKTPLLEWLGEFARRLNDYPFHEFTAIAAWETEVKANWKLGMDAFQESFHVTGTHGGSLARLFLSRANPFSHVPTAELHGPHRMESIVTGGQEYKLSPAAALAAKYGKGAAAVRTLQEGMVPKGCNPAGAADWAFDVFVFFPNILIDPVADGFFTHQFWPISAERSIYQTKRYWRPAKNSGGLYAQELGKAMFRDVAIEDSSTIELTQMGISSGAKTHLHFSDQEILCRHQYQVIEQYLAA